jgi:DUF438 domain-containing protein
MRMVTNELLNALLDSLKHPFVFADTQHVIRYVNKTAADRYEGTPAQVGRSIFDCHDENSKRIILEVFEYLKNGGDEKMIADDESQRIFMRAVRDKKGNLIGYYERYEPPAKPL